MSGSAMPSSSRRSRWFGTGWSAPVYLVIGFLIAIVAAVVIGIFLFGPLEEPVLKLFDRPIRRFISERREPWLTDLMKFLTFFGSNLFFILSGVGLAVWSYIRTRDPIWPVFVLVIVAGGLIMTSVVKELVERPRPGGGLVRASGYAFPSGHALNAAAIAGMFGFFFSYRRSGMSTLWTWRALGLVAFLVALSRVYLGVHWAVDVLAGLGLGAFWVSISISSLRPRP